MTFGLLGNDVVDLADTGRSGSAQSRFDNRVFAPQELRRIRSATEPGRQRWRYWAAKEAAYKLASRIFPGLPFSHSRFVVEPGTNPEEGRVRHPCFAASLRWQESGDWVHCLAVDFEKILPGSLRWEVRDLRDWPHPGSAVPSLPDESRFARLLARELLEASGESPALRLEKRDETRPGPVLVADSRGTPSAWEVSLSHDGSYVAAAVVRAK